MSFSKLFSLAIHKLLIWSIFLTLAGCAPSETPAQGSGFEGTLVFAMKTEITNPEMQQQMKAQMQKAKETLTGAEMEKSIRELETQMQSAEFKKQMDKNPELKQMIENQVAQLKKMRDEALAKPGSNPYDEANVMRMTMKFKDGNMLSYTGGLALDMLDGNITTLYRKADNKFYQLDHKRKTYKELKSQAGKEAETTNWTFKVTPATGDTTIQGYACRKYFIEMTHPEEKQTMRGYVWASTAIPTPPMNPDALQNNPTARAFSFIKGTPLYMEMDMNKDARIIYYLESLKKEKLDAAEFNLPAGYKKE